MKNSNCPESIVTKTEEELQQFNAQQRLVIRLKRCEEMRSKWNLGVRHANCYPDKDGKWWNARESMRELLSKGCTIGIVGNRGTGKTQLGAEAMKLITLSGYSAYYQTIVGLLVDIKATFRHESAAVEDEKAVLERYSSYHLLVIDEIGVAVPTDWGQSMFFEILNRRYARKLDTILIGSQTAKQLAVTVGQSVVDRMSETGVIINCTWDSYRHKLIHENTEHAERTDH